MRTPTTSRPTASGSWSTPSSRRRPPIRLRSSSIGPRARLLGSSILESVTSDSHQPPRDDILTSGKVEKRATRREIESDGLRHRVDGDLELRRLQLPRAVLNLEPAGPARS